MECMSGRRTSIGSLSKPHSGGVSICPKLYAEEHIREADGKSEEQIYLNSEPFCPKWVLH